MKRKDKKTTFISGVMILILSQILIKIFGLIYTLYLTNKNGFGDKGNAIYLSGYQVYALLLLISSIGIPNAISKLISEKVAIGNHTEANKIFKISIILFGFMGIIGTIILFIFSDKIAKNLIQISEAKLSLIALAPAIFLVAISSVFRGFFNGMGEVKYTAKAQRIEQIIKMIFTIIFVEIISIFSSQSIEYMAASASIATTFAVFISFVYLIIVYKFKRKEIRTEIKTSVNVKKEKTVTLIKKIFLISIPLTMSAILSTINKNIDAVTVKRILSQYLTEEIAMQKYGILSGKIDTLIGLPLSFNIALATVLVPEISTAKTNNNDDIVINRIKFSILISFLAGIACTVGLYMYAEPILSLLYPNANSGTNLLKISSITITFSMLIQTINGILHGLGKYYYPLKIMFLGMIIKLIVNIILLKNPHINIFGAVISNIISNIFICVSSFIYLIKIIRVRINIKKNIFKPILAIIIMAFCSNFILKVLSGILSEKVATIIGIINAAIVYVMAIIRLNIVELNYAKKVPYVEKICKFIKK